MTKRRNERNVCVGCCVTAFLVREMKPSSCGYLVPLEKSERKPRRPAVIGGRPNPSRISEVLHDTSRLFQTVDNAVSGTTIADAWNGVSDPTRG